MASDIDNLNSFDKDLLLRWFLHYMPMGHAGKDLTGATRTELMREYPALYNRLCGREIVTVHHNASDSPA
jgi:hypothetical protein